MLVPVHSILQISSTGEAKHFYQNMSVETLRHYKDRKCFLFYKAHVGYCGANINKIYIIIYVIILILFVDNVAQFYL